MNARRVTTWASAALHLILAGPALAAAGGADAGGVGLWTILFLGFGALIIAFQAIPGLILFGSMLGGLLRSGRHRAKVRSHGARNL